jgi:hypothetical protein
MSEYSSAQERRILDIVSQDLRQKYGLNQPYLENFTVQDLRNINLALGESLDKGPSSLVDCVVWACCWRVDKSPPPPR